MAATLTWTGGGVTSSIYDAGNWSPAQIPVTGDLLTFAGGIGLTPTLGTNLTVGSIIFETSATAFSIGGPARLTLNSGGIINKSTVSQTIDSAIALNANQTWASNAGNLIFNGNITNNASYLLSIGASGGTGNTVINGVISGSGGLTKVSTNGTLTLNGANTYTGATILSTGTVQIGNNSAFGTGNVSFSSSSLKLEALGGSRAIANNISVTSNATFQGTNDLALNGNVLLTGARTFTTNGTGQVSVNGVISGAFKLSKSGNGTLYLSGNNTFTGGYGVSAGTTIVASNTALGTGLLSFGTSTFQAGATPLVLANAFTSSGNTTFAGSQDITFNGNGSFTSAPTQTFNGSGTVTYNGALSATSALTYYKKGPGTVIFGGGSANTYSGQTLVYDGQLTLAKSAGNAFAGSLRIGDAVGAANSAIVQLNASNQIPDASALTIYTDGRLNLQSFTDLVGATTFYGGSVTGSGALSLNGSLTFSGTTGAQANIDSNLTLNADRTFTINDNGNTSIDLTINGVVDNGVAGSAIAKTGTGTLLLNGANTFSGGFSANAGIVLLGSSSVGSITSGPLGNGAVNLGNTTGSSTAGLLFNTIPGLVVANSVTARAGGTGVLTLGGLNTSGINTFAGGLLLNRSISVSAEAGGEVDFNGAITGVGGLTKIGAGIVKLNTANTFSGTVSLTLGTLAVGANDALGSGALTVTGGILDFGTNHTDTVGAVTLTNGSITGTGTLTSTGNFAVSKGSVSVGLAGTGSLTKSTTNVVTLSGFSSYTGLTSVTAGTLELARVNALASTSAVTITSGATFSLLGNNNQIGSLAGAGAVVLGAGTLTTGDGTATTYSGIISGSGGLTKVGTGVFTLGAVNTYTGPTTINNGTIRLGIANALSSAASVSLSGGSTFDLNNFAITLGSLSGAGNVTQGTGALSVGGSGTSTTLSGILSGSGLVTKNGAGTFTLTNTNTLTGAVDVTGGKVRLEGANGSLASASGVVIRSGATVELDNSVVENSNRLGNASSVTLRGGNLTLNSDGNGTSESLGSLIVASGSSKVQLNHNGGALDATSFTFSSLGTVTNGASVNFLATGGILGDSTKGPQVYITGQTVGSLLGWATVGPDAAEYFVFGVRAYGEYYEGPVGLNINDRTKLIRLSSSSANSAFTLTRAGLTTDLGLNLTDIAAVSLGSSTSNSLNLSSGSLIKSTSTATTISGNGTLTAGGVSAGNLNVSVTSGSDLTISAVITNNSGPGTVGLVKGDSGTLTLSGNNTFSGNVFINDGTVNVTSEANLGAASNDVTFNGGTLRLNSGFTSNIGKIFSVANGQTGILDIGAGQTLTLANASGVLVAGNTSSTLVKAGSGMLVVSNANAAFDGTLKVSGGTVELQNAQSLGDAVNRGIIQLDGGVLGLRANASTGFSNSLSVTSDSTIQVDRLSGSGTIVHTLGSLNIGGHTLTVAGFNSASLTLGNVNLTGAAAFLTTTADLTTGSIAGNFALSKSGAASLTVAGVSTYTGATNLDGGTLQLGAADVLPDGSNVTLAAGTTFDLANFAETIAALSGSGDVALGGGTLSFGSVSSTYSGNISGMGGITKVGPGTTNLTGAASYIGATNVSAGTLELGGVNRLNAATAVTVAVGAVLDFRNNDNQIASLSGSGDVVIGTATLTTGSASSAFNGSISGTGNLTKVGPGTLSLGGDNSYTGVTAINSGVIVARSTGALGSAGSGVTISTNAELQLENDIVLGSKPLTNSGILRNNSGNNTFSGNITQAADSTIASDAGSLVINGGLALAAKNLTVGGAGVVVLAGDIQGGTGSTLTKVGFGSTTISGDNTYLGVTVVSAGTLRVDSANALGATGSNNGTSVSSGATLLIDQPGDGLGVAAESLTINGSGVSGNGALRSLSGDNLWGGTVTLASDATVRVDADSLMLNGNLGESGGTRSLTKTGSGNLVFNGTTSNSGSINIVGGAIVLEESDRIADVSAVVISSGASLDLKGNDETVGSLSGAGNVETGSVGDNTFTVGANDATTNYSGVILGNGNFEKVGTGTITISGAQTYTGSTTISGGRIFLTGTAHGTNGITITAGGTLGGTGSTTASVEVDMGGTLTAGLSGAGQLSTGNVTLNLGSSLLVEVAGSTPGQYDSIDLTGAATIGGELNISLITGYTPNYTLLNTYGFSNSTANPNLEKFFIMLNDGTDAVTGVFSNAIINPTFFEGAPVVTLGGLQYAISYTANSATGSWIGGNDIAFIAIPEIGTFRAIALGVTLLGGLQIRRRRRSSQNF